MKMMKISDEDSYNRNGKLSNPLSLIPSNYCHYFHTLLIPSKEFTLPWKPVVSLDFHSKFSILVYYSFPYPPYSPIKLGTSTLPFHFGIRPQQQPNNPKDPYTKTKICE